MEEINELKTENLKELVYYIYKNIDKAIYLLQAIDWNKDTGFRKIKDNNFFYGFYRDGNLKGVFLFSSSNILFPFNEDVEIIKKIDMLRIIKKHNPFMIKGSEKSVDIIWRMIKKTTISYNILDCYLMKNERKKEFDIDLINQTILKYDQFDFNKSVKFLLDVEKEFNRNPLSINRLKIKIQDKMMLDEYIFLGDNKNNVISQGMIDFNSYEICVVGGIYTSQNERKKGNAASVTKKLVNWSIKRNKIPYLTVFSDNINAIDLYEKLNFIKCEKYRIIEMNLARRS